VAAVACSDSFIATSQIRASPAQVEKAQWIEQFRTSVLQNVSSRSQIDAPPRTKRPLASAELTR